jgi:hypothetical protein
LSSPSSFWFYYSKEGDGSLPSSFVFEKKKTTTVSHHLLLWFYCSKEGDGAKLPLLLLCWCCKEKKKTTTSITFFDGFIVKHGDGNYHRLFNGFAAKKMTATMSSPSFMVVVL